MTAPGTFERVYAALKQRLLEGAYKPGDRLEPAALSEQLNASVTPVRDALHRLTGERLVEAPRHIGFRVPMMTEAMLRHLFAWHRDLVLLAVANRRPSEAQLTGQLDPEQEASGHPAVQNSLFLALARAAGNPEHFCALEALMERIEPVQRLETLLFDAVEEETANIRHALQANDRRQLRKALIRYHRRRQRIVPELLERLYGP